MDLSLRQQVALNDLLLQREIAFARVYACEQEIERITEGRLILPTPPSLPSTRKTQPRKATPGPSTKATPRLRSLRVSETGYKVVYSLHGEQHEETIGSKHLLNQLCQSPVVKVLKVTTVDEHNQPQENLL